MVFFCITIIIIITDEPFPSSITDRVRERPQFQIDVSRIRLAKIQKKCECFSAMAAMAEAVRHSLSSVLRCGCDSIYLSAEKHTVEMQ